MFAVEDSLTREKFSIEWVIFSAVMGGAIGYAVIAIWQWGVGSELYLFCIFNGILLAWLWFGMSGGTARVFSLLPYYDVWEVQLNTVTEQYAVYYKKVWFSWHELEERLIWMLSWRVLFLGL